MAMYLNGHGIRETDERGEDLVDDCFVLAFNAHHEPIEFTMPGDDYAAGWTVVADTAELEEVEPVTVKAGETLTVAARATVVLQAQA
jgi:isoamylase